jgi:hypothetical protein
LAATSQTPTGTSGSSAPAKCSRRRWVRSRRRWCSLPGTGLTIRARRGAASVTAPRWSGPSRTDPEQASAASQDLLASLRPDLFFWNEAKRDRRVARHQSRRRQRDERPGGLRRSAHSGRAQGQAHAASCSVGWPSLHHDPHAANPDLEEGVLVNRWATDRGRDAHRIALGLPVVDRHQLVLGLR